MSFSWEFCVKRFFLQLAHEGDPLWGTSFGQGEQFYNIDAVKSEMLFYNALLKMNIGSV